MKIDFILPIKIDTDIRNDLAIQTMVSFFQTVDTQFFNRLIIVDDFSEKAGFRNEFQRPEFINTDLIVNYLNTEQIGVGASKNKGIELAEQFGRGDLIYIFDADVYFVDGWLEDLLEAFEKHGHEFKIIGGGIHPFLQPRRNEDVELLTSHDAISGWSWLLSYETWNKYGKLMDNSIGTGKSEDWEYCQRIRNDGFKVGCLKKQKIAHCGVTNTEGNLVVGHEESYKLAKLVAPEALVL